MSWGARGGLAAAAHASQQHGQAGDDAGGQQRLATGEVEALTRLVLILGRGLGDEAVEAVDDAAIGVERLALHLVQPAVELQLAVPGHAAEGKVQNGLGRLTGDSKLQFDGKLNEVKGKALDAYGRVIDGLDGLVEKAPVQYQDRARQGLDFARRNPLLTTGIVAGLAVLLGGLGRRR